MNNKKSNAAVLFTSVILILSGTLLLDLTKLFLTGIALGFMGIMLLVGLGRILNDEKKVEN